MSVPNFPGGIAGPVPGIDLNRLETLKEEVTPEASPRDPVQTDAASKPADESAALPVAEASQSVAQASPETVQPAQGQSAAPMQAMEQVAPEDSQSDVLDTPVPSAAEEARAQKVAEQMKAKIVKEQEKTDAEAKRAARRKMRDFAKEVPDDCPVWPDRTLDENVDQNKQKRAPLPRALKTQKNLPKMPTDAELKAIYEEAMKKSLLHDKEAAQEPIHGASLIEVEHFKFQRETALINAANAENLLAESERGIARSKKELTELQKGWSRMHHFLADIDAKRDTEEQKELEELVGKNKELRQQVDKAENALRKQISDAESKRRMELDAAMKEWTKQQQDAARREAQKMKEAEAEQAKFHQQILQEEDEIAAMLRADKEKWKRQDEEAQAKKQKEAKEWARWREQREEKMKALLHKCGDRPEGWTIVQATYDLCMQRLERDINRAHKFSSREARFDACQEEWGMPTMEDLQEKAEREEREKREQEEEEQRRRQAAEERRQREEEEFMRDLERREQERREEQMLREQRQEAQRQEDERRRTQLAWQAEMERQMEMQRIYEEQKHAEQMRKLAELQRKELEQQARDQQMRGERPTLAAPQPRPPLPSVAAPIVTLPQPEASSASAREAELAAVRQAEHERQAELLQRQQQLEQERKAEEARSSEKVRAEQHRRMRIQQESQNSYEASFPYASKTGANLTEKQLKEKEEMLVLTVAMAREDEQNAAPENKSSARTAREEAEDRLEGEMAKTVSTKASWVGLGLQVAEIAPYIVHGVVEDKRSSDDTAIQEGDQLVAVSNILTQSLLLHEVQALIRGPRGSVVKVMVLRQIERGFKTKDIFAARSVDVTHLERAWPVAAPAPAPAAASPTQPSLLSMERSLPLSPPMQVSPLRTVDRSMQSSVLPPAAVLPPRPAVQVAAAPPPSSTTLQDSMMSEQLARRQRENTLMSELAMTRKAMAAATSGVQLDSLYVQAESIVARMQRLLDDAAHQRQRRQWVGVGLQVSCSHPIYVDRVVDIDVVESTRGGGNAQAVMARDEIVSVNEIPAVFLSADEVKGLLQGPAASSVKIGLARNKSTHQVTLRRHFAETFSSASDFDPFRSMSDLGERVWNSVSSVVSLE